MSIRTMSMAAFILGGGASAAATSRVRRSVSLPLHKSYSKPSQLHYFTIVRLQSPKIKIRPFSISSKLANDSGVDYTGRRFTIGDVVKKDILKLNQRKNYFQVAAIFLVKVSFWASLAASCVAGLVTEAFLFPLWGLMYSGDCMMKWYTYIFNLYWSGTLAEIISYYVFGHGDPNQGIEEKRWKMIGQYIALNGGVVTAEEVAPYLDPRKIEYVDDESYMLPVLQIFNGHPKVDEEGIILYHFPSVHCTPLPRNDLGKEYVGRWVDRDIQVDKFFKETEWKLGMYNEETLDSVAKLLIFKLACSMGAIAILSGSVRPSYIFVPLLKMFMIYAACFGAIASKRLSSIKKLNAEIIKRNEAREDHAKALEFPNLSLKIKLSRARDLARRSSMGNNRIVYNNENDLHEQQDYERQEWVRRLEIKDANGIKDSKEKTMKSNIRK